MAVANFDPQQMANTDSEDEHRPMVFPGGNCSPSEEKKLLCQLSDSHLNLDPIIDSEFTPDDYRDIQRELETYEVISFVTPQQEAAACTTPQDEANGSHVNQSGTVHGSGASDTSETDTPSSDGSDIVETEVRSKVRSSTVTSNNGYNGDVETESNGSAQDKKGKPKSGEKEHYHTGTSISKVSHKDFCCSISRWQYHRNTFSLPNINFNKGGVKILKVLLHCRGLDVDFYERYATLTAVMQFSSKSLASSCEYTLDLDVNVYDGQVEHRSLIGSVKQCIKPELKNGKTYHITVHKVVNLDRIVYSQTCPKFIGFEIKAGLTVLRAVALPEGHVTDSRKSQVDKESHMTNDVVEPVPQGAQGGHMTSSGISQVDQKSHVSDSGCVDMSKNSDRFSSCGP